MVTGGLGWDPVQIPVADTTPETAKGQKHSIQKLSHVVPQPFLSLPPPPANGSEGAERVPPGPMISLRTPGTRIQLSTPTMGLWRSMPNGPGPPRAPPGPYPAALHAQDVPALSTPGCVGSYSHLPAGVRLGVINHQLQGLPFVGLDK